MNFKKLRHWPISLAVSIGSLFVFFAISLAFWPVDNVRNPAMSLGVAIAAAGSSILATVISLLISVILPSSKRLIVAIATLVVGGLVYLSSIQWGAALFEFLR